MNGRILQRLIWKDARTLRGLLIVTLISIAGFYALLFLFASFADLRGDDRMGLAYAIWFLMPMLMALGAPAVLVGGEEESGSLAWLQTLPASWRMIAGSKLIVMSVALLLSWGVAALLFLLYLSSLSERALGQIQHAQGLPESFWLHFSGAAVIGLALMLSSLATAYLFRSPITALLSVVPLFVFAVMAVVYAVRWVVPMEHLRRSPTAMMESNFVASALVISAALVALFVLAQLAAWRRLSWPESRLAERFGRDAVPDAFRPPPTALNSWYAASLVTGRPKKITALLWQQIWPIRWHLGLLTIVAMLGTSFGGISGSESFGVLVYPLSLFMIAALTFYGDSVRKRCLFLSDRGISPTLVWVTRVGPTLLITLMILSVASVMIVFQSSTPWHAIFSSRYGEMIVRMFVIGIAGFAISQLASQWSPRPALAFFAAPVLFFVGAFVLGGLLMFYANAWGILLVSAAILCFASWRLMPKWMAGETGRGYVVPFLSYLAFSLILPYVLVLGTRWVTMPAKQTQWRNQMLSMQLPKPEADAKRIAIQNSAVALHIDLSGTRPIIDHEGQEERLSMELAETGVMGEHISSQELLAIVLNKNTNLHHDPSGQSRSARKLQFDAVRVLMKWSRITREQAVVGNADFVEVSNVAESADFVAAEMLVTYLQREGMTPDLEALIDLMPDQNLVRQSRHNSLIRSWRKYQTLGSSFAGDYNHVPSQWWLGVERMRASRYLDELCQLMLGQWESGDEMAWNQTMQAADVLHHESYLFVRYSYWGQVNLVARSQMNLIARLRIMKEADRLREVINGY